MSKKAMDLIKSCAHCGSKKIEVARTNPNSCWIGCHKCGSRTESAKTRRGAITKWNRRAAITTTATKITWDMDKEMEDDRDE